MLITDRIKISTRKVHVDLKLNNSKIIIKGESSSGKSFIANLLHMLALNYSINSNKNVEYASKIEVFNYERRDLSKISEMAGKLIIIDNADLILAPYKEYIELINQDGANQFIMIGRFLKGIRLTPNHIATLKRTQSEDGKINLSLEYYPTKR